jgi:transcriptional regulator with XRE-family HTH domain
MPNPTSNPKLPQPVDVHVGRRIRMRRLMLNMSQTALAEGLGLTFQQVQKYEKGVNRVSASMLAQISEILQAPIPYFFQEAPESAVAGADTSDLLTAMLATRDGLALIDAYTRINDRQVRQRIVRLVEGMV